METTAPSLCPVCGAQVKEREGISKKTGKPYHMWSCSGYPNCTWVWHEPKKGTKATPQKEYEQGEKILEAVRIVNENVKLVVSKLNQLLGQ